MFSQGLNLSGVGGVMPFSSGAAAPVASATSGVAANSSTSSTNDSGASLNAVGDLQEITSTLSKRSYPAITVKAGIPVKWVINAEQSNITGCNGEMVIPEYDIEHKFVQGDNVIEFTPTKAGVFKYSCWMGMITSTITVVE